MPIDLRSLLRDTQKRDLYERSLICRGVDKVEFEKACLLYNAMRRSVRDRDDVVHGIRTGLIKDERKQKLRTLDNEAQQLATDLTKNLCKLPNAIDLLMGEVHEETRQEDVVSVVGKSMNHDETLLALGGYEELGGGCALTGIGIELVEALHGHAFGFYQHSIGASKSQTWHLPSIIKLPPERFHAIWGCCGPKCVACGNTTVQAPSWMSVLDAPSCQKIFFDRDLPVVHLLKCRPIAGHVKDEREKAREASWVRKGKTWHHCLIQPEAVLEVLFLSGPSLTADSRPIQLQTVEKMKLFYQQLAPASVITLRALPASDLLPAESSRVVVEGYLPSTRQTVVLAYLSNLLDYASAEIRHGATRQGLHVLHGQLCCIPETLAWMLEYSSQPGCVRLPDSLLKETRLRNPLRFTRKVRKGKAGRRVVVEIEKIKSSHVQANLSITPEEIQHEALTTPFDFLPFFNKFEPAH